MVRALAERGRMILRAPTGSGKSTQVPQILRDARLVDDREIVVLQPRRLAARLLARRVAEERGDRLGGEVGYQVRFEREVTAATRIRYVTEGILLRQMIDDPELSSVGAILFDEFHERHLFGDITLARALDLQEHARPDLKLGIMSATLDQPGLEAYFAPCEVLDSAGRQYEVDIHYLDRDPSLANTGVWDHAARAFGQVADEAGGHVLVFMPGAYEIQRTIRAIRDQPSSRGWEVLPLHGELAPRDQDTAVQASRGRKVIVATNVAETSITIEGVRIVIDSGQARVARYDPQRGIDTLPIEKISQASADQRAGRAGRTGPGTCLRLWTRADHAHRPSRDEPEILRMDVAEVVLNLKAAGVDDVGGFRWLDPPDPVALDRAELLLKDLGGLHHHTARITPIGRRLLRFPLHPRYARMLLAAADLGCVSEACLIAALSQGRPLLVRKAGRDSRDARRLRLDASEESDFFEWIEAFYEARDSRFDLDYLRRLGIHAQAARQADALFRQFLDLARKERLPMNREPAPESAVRQCILLGFADHLALRRDKGTLGCLIVHGRSGDLAKESVVRRSDSRLLVAVEIREITRGRGTTGIQLGLATAVKEAWLQDLFPDEFHEGHTVVYDPRLKKVVSERRRMFRDLVLERGGEGGDPDADTSARLLADEVLSGRLKLPQWNEKVDAWITRVNALAGWCPDLALPVYDDEARRLIVEQYCLGSTSFKELKQGDFLGAIKDWLTYAQREMVSKQAPERILLPGGRKARVHYDGADPWIEATIQDLYGLKESPRIARQRKSLVVHLLAPNRRAVQVTTDLANFWKEHYPGIKQQLQRRYPKHEWREIDV